MTIAKQTIYLSEYTPPPYLVDTVNLRVELSPEATLVLAKLVCRPNTGTKAGESFVLNGERMDLLKVCLNGEVLATDSYIFLDGELTIEDPPAEPFELEIETRINPAGNTALEGLYLSSGNYCTQCEAEGFRKITCFPDRPDVMAVFTTTIVADRRSCPVLLSNGNLIDSGVLDNGLHFATWHDPYKKPCYLFALVAGDLVRIADSFTTASGKEVALHIYVEERNAAKCDHAMRSLKKAMQWDEETFGLEYDLDTYMIVAVDDFNMGAMENKGLNVFNSKYVLALPETATDSDYDGIEGVIAHEYFHNWTGNRVTCRDWFQLSLKEGLTVFRDQEFTSDMLSRPVKRIQDANIIRSFQFREDSGPMAHPVRPASFVEINNFYTLTVYNKGAEVIRMMHTLLGKEGFRKGMDLYFHRHDGQAVTCDDFASAMADAGNIDLDQFKRWYSQAGTPELEISGTYNEERSEYTVSVSQQCPATPDMADKEPFHMPLSMGMIDSKGNSLDLSGKGQYTTALDFREAKQEFIFKNIKTKPTLSFLRNFSAPVKVKSDLTDADLGLLMASDPDPFNRWDAGQQLGLKCLLEQISSFQQGGKVELNATFVHGMEKLLSDTESEPAFIAQAITLPSENWISQQVDVIDPQAVFAVRQEFRKQLAERLNSQFLERYQQLSSVEKYIYSAAEAGRRSLRNCCLGYLLALDPQSPTGGEMLKLGVQQYHGSDNMTDVFSALAAVVNSDLEAGGELLGDFYSTWQHDPLVVDKWLMMQAACVLPGTLDRVRELTGHPSFTLKNPNKVRSLIGVFCSMNHNQFHASDGQGYAFLADNVITLDGMNPQIASRLITPLTMWKRYRPALQNLMREQLLRIGNRDDTSSDVGEIVSKSLG